jgi:hypothetical protein
VDVHETRAARTVIRDAAAALRHRTAQDQYRGGKHPAAAFSLCLVLDEIALHAGSLPDEVRAAVTGHCRAILHHRGAK